MIDLDVIISENISRLMKDRNISQSVLAENLGISEAEARKLLNGARTLSSRQLHQAADFFGVSVDELISVPENVKDANVVHALMNQVHTDAAREALEIADELADMIIFHTRVMENAREMMQVMENV